MYYYRTVYYYYKIHSFCIIMDHHNHHHQNSFLATSMITTIPNLMSSFHSTTTSNNMTSSNRYHFEKLDIHKPTIQSILTPIGRIIRHDGDPIVSNAIQRRDGRIKQFFEITHQDLKDKKADEAELQCLQDKVKEIKTSNNYKENIKSELINKIAQMKKMSKLKKEEKKLDRVLKRKDKLQEIWDANQKEIAQYDEFQRQIGVLYLGLRPRIQENLHNNTPSSSSHQETNENQTTEILISCYKIHPDFPDDVYNLYFREFVARANDMHFTVIRAEPSFPEFESISSIYNESQDFKGLINKVREHWIVEANKEGQPRVGTPSTISPKHGLENNEKLTIVSKSPSTTLLPITKSSVTSSISYKTSSPHLQKLPPKTRQVLEPS